MSSNMLSANKLLVVLVGACGFLISCSTGWQININGTANGSDSARAVTVDAAGNVVAGGSINNIDTGFGFTVVKVSGLDGAELWRQVINGTDRSNNVNQATAVRTDDAGNVVAVGSLANTRTGLDQIVVKFDGGSGTELWRRAIKGTANLSDVVRSVAVDSFRNVVVAGYTFNERRYHDFTVIKFDGTSGAELWRQLIRGTGIYSSEASQVTVDARGDVLAVGFSVNAGTYGDFTVVKFDGVSGAELWRRAINGSADDFDEALAVTVDSVGDVIAAGNTDNAGTSYDFTVIKFDGVSGRELWRSVINGSANGRDSAISVAVDAVGNVVAAGSIVNAGTYRDFTVIKFDGISGAELWRQVIKGTADGNDYAFAVTVDVAADVIAAGSTQNRLTGDDFTVAKFDRITGEELWRRVINGSGNGSDWAFAVTVDAAGDVVAAGRTANTGTGDDFIVVKMRGTDGSSF